MSSSAVAFLWERFEWAREEAAFIAGDLRASYGDLLDATDDCRRWMIAESVGAGSVVLLKGDYSTNSVAALLALLDLGAVVIPLSPANLRREAEFAEAGEAELILDTLGEPSLLHTGRTASNSAYRPLREAGEAGLVVFSSGSAGKSSAIVHGASRLMTRFLEPRRDLRTLSFLPFDHIGGFATLFYCLSNASTLVIPAGRDPETVCAAIARHGVEALPAAPNFLKRMLLSGAHDRHDLSSLKIVACGAETMSQTTLERCASALPHVRLLQRHGAMASRGAVRSATLIACAG
jgi:acyl-CoA synthetase (AMP-forming)/AMP-acid ligase II